MNTTMLDSIKRTVLLEPLYDRVLAGLPALGTPAEMAARFGGADAEGGAGRDVWLARLYTGLGGMTGFVCGLPGWLMMPLTVPADVVGAALLELHLCATMATLRGADPADDAVKETCMRCVLESELDEEGAQVDADETRGFAHRVGRKVLERGARLLIKQVVKRGTRRLLRGVPMVGGVIGGVSDARAMQRLAERAREAFAELNADAEGDAA